MVKNKNLSKKYFQASDKLITPFPYTTKWSVLDYIVYVKLIC